MIDFDQRTAQLCRPDGHRLTSTRCGAWETRAMTIRSQCPGAKRSHAPRRDNGTSPGHSTARFIRRTRLGSPFIIVL